MNKAAKILNKGQGLSALVIFMASKKSRKKQNLKNKIITLAVIVVVVVAIVLAAKYLKSSDKAAAKVNGDVIMKEDVLRVYLNVPPEYRMVMTAQSILEGMIIEKLLVQEAEKQGISVPDEAVDQYVEELMASYGMTEENLTQSLEESGMTLKELKKSFKEKMMISELLEKTILSGIEVTDEEAESYYYDNVKQFTTPAKVMASHIIVNSTEEAESIRRKAIGGADFAKLAKEYSIGPSGPRGGTLGWFSRGEMVGPFEDAAFALKVGGISKVVQTTYGYHIIKVEDKKDAVVQTLDNSLKEEIRYALAEQKEAAAINIYTEQLEAAADIEIFMTSNEEKEPDYVATLKNSASTAAPEEEPEPEYSGDSIAECMTSKGAKMYGSESSSTSNKQKELFGNDFADIDYTDCSSDNDACESAGVVSYPTWVINEKKYVGKYSLDRLAEISGC
jgi:parvulin-like peptidyl-prolyl isomerase